MFSTWSLTTIATYFISFVTDVILAQELWMAILRKVPKVLTFLRQCIQAYNNIARAPKI